VKPPQTLSTLLDSLLPDPYLIIHQAQKYVEITSIISCVPLDVVTRLLSPSRDVPLLSHAGLTVCCDCSDGRSDSFP